MLDQIVQELTAIFINLVGCLGVSALVGVLIAIGVGFAMDISERRAARRWPGMDQSEKPPQNAP